MGSSLSDTLKWQVGWEEGVVQSPLKTELRDAKITLTVAGILVAMNPLDAEWKRAVHLRYTREWFKRERERALADSNKEAFGVVERLIEDAIKAVKPDAKTGNSLLSQGKAAQAITDAYDVTKKFKEGSAGSTNVTNTAEIDDHQYRRDDGKLVKIGHRSVKLSQEVLDLVKIDEELKAKIAEHLIQLQGQRLTTAWDAPTRTNKRVELMSAIDGKDANHQAYTMYKNEVEQLRMQRDVHQEFVHFHNNFSNVLHGMTTKDTFDGSAMKDALTAAIRMALVDAEIAEDRITYVLDVFKREFSVLDPGWTWAYWARYTMENGGKVWLNGNDEVSGAWKFAGQIGLTAFALVALIGFDLAYVGYTRPWRYYACMMALVASGPLTTGSLHTSIASILALHAVLGGVKMSKMPDIYTRNLMQGISVGSARQPLLMGVGKAGWSVWNLGPDDIKSPINHIFAEA